MTKNKNGNGGVDKNREKSDDDVYFEFQEQDQLFTMYVGKDDQEPATINPREIIDMDFGGQDTLDSTSTLYSFDTLQSDDFDNE